MRLSAPIEPAWRDADVRRRTSVSSCVSGRNRHAIASASVKKSVEAVKKSVEAGVVPPLPSPSLSPAGWQPPPCVRG